MVCCYYSAVEYGSHATVGGQLEQCGVAADRFITVIRQIFYCLLRRLCAPTAVHAGAFNANDEQKLAAQRDATPIQPKRQ